MLFGLSIKMYQNTIRGPLYAGEGGVKGEVVPGPLFFTFLFLHTSLSKLKLFYYIELAYGFMFNPLKRNISLKVTSPEASIYLSFDCNWTYYHKNGSSYHEKTT